MRAWIRLEGKSKLTGESGVSRGIQKVRVLCSGVGIDFRDF